MSRHRMIRQRTDATTSRATTEGGFTLMELLICLLILGLIIIPLGTALVQGYETNRSVVQRIDGSQAAQQISRIFPQDVLNTAPDGIDIIDSSQNPPTVRQCGSAPAAAFRKSFAWDLTTTEPKFVEYDAIGTGADSVITRTFCKGFNDPNPQVSVVAQHFGWNKGGTMSSPSYVNYPATRFVSIVCDAPTQACVANINVNVPDPPANQPADQPHKAAFSGSITAHYRASQGVGSPGQASSPQNVTATPDYQTVLVAWSPPSNSGNDTITGYDIDVQPQAPAGSLPSNCKVKSDSPAGTCRINVNDGSATRYEVGADPNFGPLSNFHAYRFRVRAVTKVVGGGVWSPWTPYVTPVPSPPHAPTNVTIAAVQPFISGLDVTWRMATNNGGAGVKWLTLTVSDINGANAVTWTGNPAGPNYLAGLACDPLDSCPASFHIPVADPSSGRVGLSGGPRNNGDGVSWVASLTATSALGTSPRSALSNAVTELGVPDYPTNLSATLDTTTGATTLTWKWDPATQFDGGGALTGFDVRLLNATSSTVGPGIDPANSWQPTTTDPFLKKSGTTYTYVIASTLPAINPTPSVPGSPQPVPAGNGLDPGWHGFTVQATNFMGASGPLDSGSNVGTYDAAHAPTYGPMRTGRIADPVPLGTDSAGQPYMSWSKVSAGKCPTVWITNAIGQNCELWQVKFTQPAYDGLEPPNTTGTTAGWDSSSQVTRYKLRFKAFGSRQCVSPERYPLATENCTMPPGTSGYAAIPLNTPELLYLGQYQPSPPWPPKGNGTNGTYQWGQNSQRVYAEDCSPSKNAANWSGLSTYATVPAPWTNDSGPSGTALWGCTMTVNPANHVKVFTANLIRPVGVNFDLFVSATNALGDGSWTKLPPPSVTFGPPQAVNVDSIIGDTTVTYTSSTASPYQVGLFPGTVFNEAGAQVALCWASPYAPSSLWTSATYNASKCRTADFTQETDHYQITQYHVWAKPIGCPGVTGLIDAGVVNFNPTGSDDAAHRILQSDPLGDPTQNFKHCRYYQFGVQATNAAGTTPANPNDLTFTGSATVPKTWDTIQTCSLMDVVNTPSPTGTKTDGGDGWIDFFPGAGNQVSRLGDNHYRDNNLTLRRTISGGTPYDTTAYIRFDPRPSSLGGSSCDQVVPLPANGVIVGDATLRLWNVTTPSHVFGNIITGTHTEWLDRYLGLYKATKPAGTGLWSWSPATLRADSATAHPAPGLGDRGSATFINQSKANGTNVNVDISLGGYTSTYFNSARSTYDPGFALVDTGGQTSLCGTSLPLIGCIDSWDAPGPYVESKLSSWWGGQPQYNNGTTRQPELVFNFY